MPRPQEIARYCSSLTKVTARRKHVDEYDMMDEELEETVTELQLAHFSVQEYLMSDRIAESFRKFLRQSRAEAEIVRVSLAYLCTAARRSNVENSKRGLPFLKFCTRNWMTHALVAEQEDGVAELCVSKIFTAAGVYVYWLHFFDPDRPPRRSNILQPRPEPLYYASLGGLAKSVRLLLDKGAEIDAQGGHHGNALQAASIGGREEVVRLLLDKGAEVNARGGRDGNALQAASTGGYEEVVRLLLDKGAEVNAQGEYYGNALQAASIGGREEVVRLLLDKGAEVNAQGGHHGNALQAASTRGREEVVRLLLDKGAEINAQGGLYGNALQAASIGGHEEVVRLLLDKGAEVNAQGGHYGNAL